MQALIRLQSIPSIPVAAGLDEGAGALDVPFNKEFVAEEEADANDGEDYIDLGA